MLEETARVARAAAGRASSLDHDGAFPTEDIDALARIGLLVLPFPAEFGGIGIGTTPQGQGALFDVLRVLGAGSLAIGRLYEGHVNAIALVCRYGTRAQKEKFAAEVSGGHLSAFGRTLGFAPCACRRTGVSPIVRHQDLCVWGRFYWPSLSDGPNQRG